MDVLPTPNRYRECGCGLDADLRLDVHDINHYDDSGEEAEGSGASQPHICPKELRAQCDRQISTPSARKKAEIGSEGDHYGLRTLQSESCEESRNRND